MTVRILPKMAALGLLVLALGCGSSLYYRGTSQLEHGQVDEAVANLDKAHQENPKSVRIHTALVRAKLAASTKHMEAAKFAIAREDYETAALELSRVLEYDPGNQRAQDMLDKVLVTAKAKQDKARAAAVSIDQMKKEYQNDLGVPQLDPASNIPIVLKFSDTPLKTILDALSKASGINFLYDDKTEATKRVSVDFAKVDMAQVLDYLMMQTKNFYKVLDPHTLIVIPDSKQKRQEYEDQVIRTFYLSNADAKDVFQLVRSILQTRKMAMNQDLNSITIQDTPEMVAIAQKIIEENDKSKGEVIVDVELLEVDSNKLRNIGMDLSTHQFLIGPGHNLITDSSGNTSIGTGGPVPLNELGQTLSHDLWVSPVPNLVVNLLLTDTSTTVLAKPQLRVLEGQKASVHIGDRIPIPTANQYLGSTGTSTTYTPITSYTYQDIGVKIEIEPRVHHNREVTLKLKSEVSAQTGEVAASGLTPAQPIIGTREASSVIRLQDGETSLLAGLIQQTDKNALSGIPGIAEIPILRRLFSNTNQNKTSTDVVLLLTPHIIRMPNITADDIKPLWVGTVDNPQLKGVSDSFAPSPFAGGEAPAEDLEAQPEKPAPEAKEEPAGVGEAGKTGQDNEGEDNTPPAANAGQLLVSPSSITVQPGGQATINLVLVGAVDIKGAHLEIEYPNDVLSFQGADEGAFFKLGNAPTSFAAQETRPGLITIDTGRTDGAGSAGSGLLARLVLNAVKPGVARVNVGVGQAATSGGQMLALPSGSTVVTVVQTPAGTTSGKGTGG